jgi:hypothetical protein
MQIVQIWDSADPGVEDYKRLIGNCLPAQGCSGKTTAEENLDVLQGGNLSAPLPTRLGPCEKTNYHPNPSHRR